MFLVANTRALDTWKFLIKSAPWIFYCSNTEAAQNFHSRWSRYKRSKKFWLDQRACAVRLKKPDFGFSGAGFPRANARIPKPVSTGVENGLVEQSLPRVDFCFSLSLFFLSFFFFLQSLVLRVVKVNMTRRQMLSLIFNLLRHCCSKHVMPGSWKWWAYSSVKFRWP